MTAHSSASWIVVTDFDGTLTMEDVGNSLCQNFIPELYKKVYSQYDLGHMSLRAEQHILWKGFPLNESDFRLHAVKLAEIRPGVNDFLEKCYNHQIPVYIASCGMRPYIEAIINAHLSPLAQKAVAEIRCNEVRFDEKSIIELKTPIADEKHPLPFDKGAWAKELSQRHGGSKILIIGDGSSDFSMIESADLIFATRKLAKKCKEKDIPFVSFEDFTPLFKSPLFS